MDQISQLKWTFGYSETHPMGIGRRYHNSGLQRAWDAGITTAVYNNLLENVLHTQWSGMTESIGDHTHRDWLHALPLTAIGFRLSDEAICVATGYCLGTVTCQPHTCICEH